MKVLKLKPLVVAIGLASQILAQSSSAQDTEIEEVIVTGFRQSLAKSLDNKREAVNAVDSIVAEDIGKMPDLNLAEALQRSAGVAIVREGGEGRKISLRGLDADFTHVTLNGMEVPASTGGLDSTGGANRGRGFDFNVFSAELFNRIDIHKSSTASVEEGGIAGSVELYSMRPLDNPGGKIVVSGQMGYNDLSEQNDPRFTAIYADSNDEETFGWMLSAAYTERTAYQDGFGTVRWDSPTADGGRSFAGNNTSLSDDIVNGLWYPRLPRQDSFHHDQDRTGLSGAIQFRPNDSLEFGVNYVSSKFDSVIDSYNAFAEFRRSGQWGWPHNTVESVTVATDGGVDYAVAGSFSGVGLRTESRRQVDTTEFTQLTSDLKWNIRDNLVLSAMVGNATSDFYENYFRANIETLNDNLDTPAINDGGAVFSYDFRRNANVATMTYDIDVTNPDNFYILSDERIWDYAIDRTNNTQRVDLDWELTEESNFKFGFIINDRELDSREYRQDLPVPTDLASISKIYSFDDTGEFGDATTLDFLVLDFDKASAAFGKDQSLAQGAGIQTWTVEEQSKGIYAEYNVNTEVAGHGLRVNAGIRNVATDIKATGWIGTEKNVESNDFSNTLPALNVVLDISDEMLLRLGVAKTLTRPGMDSLAPSKAYSDTNQRVTGGNSQLEPLLSDDLNLSWEWYFAEEALFAINYFQKDIDSFISSPIEFGSLRAEDIAIVASLYPGQPALLDPLETWEYRTSQNTDGTNLKGWEMAYQQTLTFLPSLWSNLGLLINYSSIDAETTVDRGNGPEQAPLPGLSKTSYNAVIFYEVETWGARVAVNNRDDYVTSNIGSNNNYSEATTGPTHMDFSSFYNLTDEITLTFEAINLTDEYERLYTTGPTGTMNLVREYNHTGRQLFFGVRASF